jgi:hypothetical protein
LCTVQHFRQIGFRKIELKQAEFAHVRRDEVLHNGVPTLLSEERLIANENVRRP